MNTDVVIFVGPTLDQAQARELLDARYLPPAAQGDVYREARSGPLAIGIIDGYFEQVPAVWHKEILWAISHGVHVFGASSMGALRAAELHRYGMHGCGKIWRDFLEGRLEDDDEVTIVHGPAESGYIKASEAMVNIRATLESATEQKIIDPDTRDCLLSHAKVTWYPHRNYADLTKSIHSTMPDISNRLQHWLTNNRIDQKALDAKTMLMEMSTFLEGSPAPATASFHFEHTDAWEQVRREVDRKAGPSVTASGDPAVTETHGMRYDELLDELRLFPATYHRTVQLAMQRRMARELSLADGIQPDTEKLKIVHDQFRQQRNLHQPEAIQQWLADNHMDARRFTDLLESLFHTDRIQRLMNADIDRDLGVQMILDGIYPEQFNRAQTKHALLEHFGLENPSVDDADVSEQALWQWFLTERDDGKEMPENLSAYAQQLGFYNREQMRRALLREYCYLQRINKERSPVG